MLINVKNLSEKIISLNVPEAYTIRNIKEMFQKMEGIGSHNLKLVFEGKILDDNKQISSTNIKPTDTLCLMIAIRRLL